MEKSDYDSLRSSYKPGTQFTLTTNRLNGNLTNKVFLSSDRKLKFVDGEEIFDPDFLGGCEYIVSITPVE